MGKAMPCTLNWNLRLRAVLSFQEEKDMVFGFRIRTSIETPCNHIKRCYCNRTTENFRREIEYLGSLYGNLLDIK